MITKAEAQALAKVFQEKLPQRAEEHFARLARTGIVGGSFSYTQMDDDDKTAAALIKDLEAGDWNVEIDKVNRIITAS